MVYDWYYKPENLPSWRDMDDAYDRPIDAIMVEEAGKIPEGARVEVESFERYSYSETYDTEEWVVVSMGTKAVELPVRYVEIL
jgi:hypothetical protein